jgi:hypothetical protein
MSGVGGVSVVEFLEGLVSWFVGAWLVSLAKTFRHQGIFIR